MKKISILFIGATIIASCDSNQHSKTADSIKTDTGAKTGANTEVVAKAEVDSAKIWSYKTDVDKMTSKNKFFATIAATNELQFDAPYDGGSVAVIILRNQDNTNEVMLSIDKGQFTCGVEGCDVKVRFDNDPAITFTASEPSDGSSTLLFVKPAAKFIKHAKTAKHIIIQAEFYQSGLKEMEFNTEGLKWDH
jgi:hypothetical protein